MMKAGVPTKHARHTKSSRLIALFPREEEGTILVLKGPGGSVLNAFGISNAVVPGVTAASQRSAVTFTGNDELFAKSREQTGRQRFSRVASKSVQGLDVSDGAEGFAIEIDGDGGEAFAFTHYDKFISTVADALTVIDIAEFGDSGVGLSGNLCLHFSAAFLEGFRVRHLYPQW